MERTLEVKREVGWGVIELIDGILYTFDYGIPKDKGLGALISTETSEEYTVTNIIYDDKDNIISITVEVDK